MQRPPLQRPSPSHQSQGCAARANLAVVAPPAMAPQAGCSRTRRRDKRRERCQGACAPRRPPGPVAVYEHARGPGQSLRSLSGASRVRHARGGEKRRSFRLFSVLGTYRYRAARGRPVGPPPPPPAPRGPRWRVSTGNCGPLHPRSPVPGPRARAAGASWRVVGSSRLRCGTRLSRHARVAPPARRCARAAGGAGESLGLPSVWPRSPPAAAGGPVSGFGRGPQTSLSDSLALFRRQDCTSVLDR